MSLGPEIDGAHPFGVVHAGQCRNNDSRRETVIRRQVGVVDPQCEKRIRVQDLVGLQGGAVETRRGVPPNARMRISARVHPPARPGPAAAPRSTSRWSTIPRRRRSAGGRCAASARPASARSSTIGLGPPVRVRRHRSPVRSGVIRAAAAVRLTAKSFGPVPRLSPRGSSSAAWRVNPPMVWPAVITAMNTAPPPTSARAPRRLIVAGPGSAAASPSGSYGSARVSSRLVRNTFRIDIDRSPAHMRGILMVMWITKPTMKTQAP